MSINLAEIQQKVDRLLYNIAEQNRKAYQLFYDPNPQDVSLPQLDENGNLITVSIPNRAKIKKQMWDDVNAAIGLWNRTFYVDAVNGDDNNPGTQDAPFKTIKKAVDSVPIGGVVTVRLVESQEYIINYDINVTNKTVLITGSTDSSKRPTLIGVQHPGRLGNSTVLYGFNISKGNLILCGLNINLPAPEEGKSVPCQLPQANFIRINWYHFARISLNRVTAVCEKISGSSFPLIGTNTWDHGGLIDISTYYFEGKSDGPIFKFAGGFQNVVLLWMYSSMKDLNGNDVPLGDRISGIVRDANGVPRNIISNVVL